MREVETRVVVSGLAIPEVHIVIVDMVVADKVAVIQWL